MEQSKSQKMRVSSQTRAVRCRISEERLGREFVREPRTMDTDQNYQRIQAEKTGKCHAMFLKEASSLAFYLSLNLKNLWPARSIFPFIERERCGSTLLMD